MIKRGFTQIVRRIASWVIFPVLSIQMTACVSASESWKTSGITARAGKIETSSCEDNTVSNDPFNKIRFESYSSWDEEHLGVFDWFRDVVDRSRAWRRENRSKQCSGIFGDRVRIHITKSVKENYQRFLQSYYFANRDGETYDLFIPPVFCSNNWLDKSRKHKYTGSKRLIPTCFMATRVADGTSGSGFRCHADVIHRALRKDDDKSTASLNHRNISLVYADGFRRFGAPYHSVGFPHVMEIRACRSVYR